MLSFPFWCISKHCSKLQTHGVYVHGGRGHFPFKVQCSLWINPSRVTHIAQQNDSVNVSWQGQFNIFGWGENWAMRHSVWQETGSVFDENTVFLSKHGGSHGNARRPRRNVPFLEMKTLTDGQVRGRGHSLVRMEPIGGGGRTHFVLTPETRACLRLPALQIWSHDSGWNCAKATNKRGDCLCVCGPSVRLQEH